MLREGTRLLADVDTIANRVKRVATGWEPQLTIAVADSIQRGGGISFGLPARTCSQSPACPPNWTPESEDWAQASWQRVWHNLILTRDDWWLNAWSVRNNSFKSVTPGAKAEKQSKGARYSGGWRN